MPANKKIGISAKAAKKATGVGITPRSGSDNKHAKSTLGISSKAQKLMPKAKKGK